MTESMRNLQQTCRACLCSVGAHISLSKRVSVCDEEVILSDIILSCTGVSVSTDDGYPQSLCATCYNDAHVAYRFQVSCLKSAKILQDELGRAVVKIENVFDPLVDDHKSGIMVPIKDELADCVPISYNDDLKQLQSKQNTSNVGEPLCKICQTYFSDWISLEHHLENCYARVEHALTHETPSADKTVILKQPKKSKWYKCIFCIISYKFPAELRNHMMTHITVKHYLCIYCGNKFNLSHRSECKQTQSQHSRKHINKITNNKTSDSLKTQPRLCCSVCNKSYRRQKYLMNHKCNPTHTVATYFECLHCKKRFTKLRYLKTHERIHTGEKPYQCVHCNMRFLRNYELTRHILTHMAATPFECSYCNKRFNILGNLKTHERIHTSQKSYQCLHCNKRFLFSNDLKRHILVHTGEKPYPCSYCSKRFNHRGHVNSHERTHTGEKPYKCSHCSNRFATRSNLTKHTRIHTGEKSYPCLLCNKRFSQSSYLKKHYLTHPSEETIQPFKCSHCDKCFPNLDMLKMHICTSSSEKSYECSRCSERFSQLGQLMSHKLTHLRKT